MKLIEFPKQQGATSDIIDFLERAKGAAQENGATQAVVIMLNDEGDVGMLLDGDYISLVGMLALAMKSI